MIKRSAQNLGIDVSEVERRIAENWSLPTRFYQDGDVFDFEMDAIFSKRWQFFCPVHSVMNPGDVAVRRIGKHPIVVTRDRHGVLHGFLNICRHRGYTVAEHDRKNCARLVCRYHMWSYNLDGTLAHAPDADGDAGFEREELGLHRVSVDQWGPVVLVNPDPCAAPLRRTYPVMFDTARRLGFDPDPDRYTPYKTIHYDIDTNWKLWYDNGTECYHCPHIHSESFGAAFNVEPEDTTIRLDENFSSYHFKSGSALKGNDLSAENFKSFQLYPGMTFIVHDEFMHMTGMTPIGPGKTRHSIYYFAENGTDPGHLERWLKIWDDTYREDNEITAVQYENLKGGQQPYNRYVSSREFAAQHFNAMIWADYKQALAA